MKHLLVLFLLVTSPILAFSIEDPLEPVNRGVFQFNEGLNKMVLDPAVDLYEAVLPDFLRMRMVNVVNFLMEPRNLINHLIVGDAEKACITIGRILTNGVIGIGGFVDMASDAGLYYSPNDFGLSMKHYGVDTGIYLVLPVVGPSSTRDAVGFAGDYFMDPTNLQKFNKYKPAKYGITLLVRKSQGSEDGKTLNRVSLDKYAAVRSIYLQMRGNPGSFELEDFDEIENY